MSLNSASHLDPETWAFIGPPVDGFPGHRVHRDLSGVLALKKDTQSRTYVLIGQGGIILAIRKGGIFEQANLANPPEKRVEIGDSVVSINGEENFIGRSSDIIASDQLVMFWERGPFSDNRVLVIAKEAGEAWGLKFKPDGTITEVTKGKAVDRANLTRKPEAQIRPGDRIVSVNRVPGHSLLGATKQIAFVVRLVWERRRLGDETKHDQDDRTEPWKSWPGGGQIVPYVAPVSASQARETNLTDDFESLRLHINYPGITLEWWELHFGTVLPHTLYGVRFWDGFLKLFRQYLSAHIYFRVPAESFRHGLLRKSVSWNMEGAFSTPLSEHNPAVPDSVWPCFGIHFFADFYSIVCIRTVLFGSPPIIAHGSWIVFT